MVGYLRVTRLSNRLTGVIGMFLWVRLMLGTLSNLNSATALEKAVETLPRGIKKAYGYKNTSAQLLR